MYQGGRTFAEEVYANDVKAAKETAISTKKLSQVLQDLNHG